MDQSFQETLCPEHKEKISKIYSGNQAQASLRLMCDQCQSIQPSMDVDQIKLKFLDFQTKAKFFSFQRREFLYKLEFRVQEINNAYSSFIKLFTDLNEQIKEKVEKSEEKISSIIKKEYNQLNAGEVLSFTNLLTKEHSPILTSLLESDFQESLTYLIDCTLAQLQQQNSYIASLLEKLYKQITTMNYQIHARQSDFLKDTVFNESIDVMDFSSDISKLILASKNSLLIYLKKKDQFQHIQTIKSEHERITSICLDRQNRIYTAGTDGKVQTFIHKFNQFHKELQFDTEAKYDYFKLHFDEKSKQLIACNKINIQVFEGPKNIQKLADDLKYKELNLISCFAINNDILVFNNETELLIWQRQYNKWEFLQEIKCQQVMDLCFTKASEFLSLDQNQQVYIWRLKDRSFHAMESFTAQFGSLLFDQNSSLLLCFNKSSCNYYQVYENKFHFITKQCGENIKLCLSKNSAQIIFHNLGKLSIFSAEQILSQ